MGKALYTPLWLILLLLAALIGTADSFLPSSRTFLSREHQLFAGTEETSRGDDDDDGISLEAFQARKQKQEEEDEEFDGYILRDVIYEKWGRCYDVEFNSVESFGSRSLYLNILPFHLGGRTFRHESELAYLCHLQAVVEILLKYDQLGYVLLQIDETKKKPRAGTSPLVAVPLRLDLTREQVDEISS